MAGGTPGTRAVYPASVTELGAPSVTPRRWLCDLLSGPRMAAQREGAPSLGVPRWSPRRPWGCWTWRPPIRGRRWSGPARPHPEGAEPELSRAAPGVMDVCPPPSESPVYGSPKQPVKPWGPSLTRLPGGPDRQPGGFRAALRVVACGARGPVQLPACDRWHTAPHGCHGARAESGQGSLGSATRHTPWAAGASLQTGDLGLSSWAEACPPSPVPLTWINPGNTTQRNRSRSRQTTDGLIPFPRNGQNRGGCRGGSVVAGGWVGGTAEG